MKGGGGGKEPPVEGEISGKRPKRKCLQWHPLLAKKAPDFSEEEEEEDEEELEKVNDYSNWIHFSPLTLPLACIFFQYSSLSCSLKTSVKSEVCKDNMKIK